MRVCVVTALIAWMCALAAAQPPLPEANGHVDIAAQEWAFEPGHRTIRVYVRYPDGVVDSVGPETGLMLVLHNWGGTDASGAPDPEAVAARYNVVAVSVDYVQSGRYDAETDPPYDFGWLQALDALRALHYVWTGLESADRPFHTGRVYATGGSGGGNVSLMANKLAPRTFACIVDLCGMAKLNDDIAFGLEGGSRLNAGYSRDASSPRYLSPDAQAIRFVGHPGHLATLRALGNACRVVVVHGAEDDVCPAADKREMVANMQAAGVAVDPHFVSHDALDGTTFTSTGHPLGNRTRILFRVADRYLLPTSASLAVRTAPPDFERGDEVAYETESGSWIIDFSGPPTGRFEPHSG